MLDKAIAHGKEHRKQYTGAKAIDRACRNHGRCEWCYANRKKHKILQDSRAMMRMQIYEKGECE